MTARASLRAATSEAHERVDHLFSSLDLGRIEDYRLFLLAQAAAYLPIETALDEAGAAALLDDWPGRRRGNLLLSDLNALRAKAPEPIPAPLLTSQAAMLGAIYVLEGSRLGGALLKQQIPAEAPRLFLSAPQQAGSWRKLLDNLDRFLYRPELLDAAIDAARDVFQRFEAGGLHYLGKKRA